MDRISVVWQSYHEPEIIARGYWDQALLEEFFAGERYEHYSSFDDAPAGGAVVIINGRTHADVLPLINRDLCRLKWYLVLLTGDEEALFPWTELHHPLMRVWAMSPRMGVHNHCGRLPNGYRPTTRALLRNVGRQERGLDFFFAGQVNHGRREECVNALRHLPRGMIVETERFGEEKLSYPDYLRCLAQTKVVPCPSGSQCPDTFRLWEALEAGCLPVVDSHATITRQTFWPFLFPEGFPFPIVESWYDFPDLLPTLLNQWTTLSNYTFSWWLQYRDNLRRHLERDIQELWRP